MSRKVSPAEQLGKRGGKATAAKRTAEERSESARKASRKRWESERADREPDTFIFELAMDGRSFVDYSDKKRKSYYFSNHRAKVLLDLGYLDLDHEEKHVYPTKPPDDYTDIYYRPTEAGMNWWISARIAAYEKAIAKNAHYKDMVSFDIPDLATDLEGKGMGSDILIGMCCYRPAVFKALRDGLLSFVGHSDYSGMPHSHNEYITVRLTQKGFNYFASLPRFVEVWE